MYGILVNIGRHGNTKWKWVNDPATGAPFESDVEGALDRIIQWFSMDRCYMMWNRDSEVPT